MLTTASRTHNKSALKPWHRSKHHSALIHRQAAPRVPQREGVAWPMTPGPVAMTQAVLQDLRRERDFGSSNNTLRCGSLHDRLLM